MLVSSRLHQGNGNSTPALIQDLYMCKAAVVPHGFCQAQQRQSVLCFVSINYCQLHALRGA